MVRLHDRDLFNEYQYTLHLIRLLPRIGSEDIGNIEDKIKLEYASLTETFRGAIVLDEKPPAFVPGGSTAPKAPNKKKDTLQSIIDKVNERFSGNFTDADRVIIEGIYQMFMRDSEVSMCDRPDAERLMLELAAQLETVKGKKSYGYLPKRLKKLVDEIVDEMERLPGVSRCYDQWLLLQGKVAAYYHDKPQERIPLSQQKEFRQIKNAVIQEAERLRLGEISFEEKGLNQQDEPEEYSCDK